MIRKEDEIYKSLDLAYVIHWGIIHSQLNNLPMPTKIAPIAVIERRRALEWIISDVSWDEVSLDT